MSQEQEGALEGPIKTFEMKRQLILRGKANGTNNAPATSRRRSNPPVVEALLTPESDRIEPLALARLEPQPKTTRGRKGSGKAKQEGVGSSESPARTTTGNGKGRSRRSGPNPSAQLPSSPPPFVSTSTEGPGGGGNGANNSPVPTRRIFTPAFKRAVLNAFASDPECIGNQRATARKFGVHRRQVQKWLRQEQDSDSPDKDKESSSDEPHPNSQEPTVTQSAISSSEDPENKSQDKEAEPEDSADLSPSHTPEFDLCKMSTAAMALSLNLTMNSNNAGMESRLSGINKHPSSLAGVPMPSPNSLLSKFYGLAYNNNPNNMPAPPPPTYQNHKYDSPNLTKNTPPLPRKVPTINTTAAKTRIAGNQNQRPSYTPTNQTNSSYYYVDEIAAMYPHMNFDILRQAVLRNEVTFTKLKTRVPESTFVPPNHSGNGRLKNDTSRCSSPSLSPPESGGNGLSDMYTMELLRQQNEYVKLMQQAGINFPSLTADPNAYAGETMRNKSKHPWLHPLAQAAAATLGYPGLNGQRKPQTPEYNAAARNSPMNSKPKTVAAALAASRLSPNSLLGTMSGNMYEPLLGTQSKRKPAIPSQRRRKPKPSKPNCTATRPDEDYLDPTSFLEVTTSSGYDGNNSANGVDMTGTGNQAYMNGHHFLTTNMDSLSPHNGDLTNGEYPSSKLKNYLEQNDTSPPDSSSPNGENDQEKVKSLALHAFTYDPEVSGDARAVARKHGLNARVVMKWIKEGSAKSFPMLNPAVLDNSAPPKKNGATSVLESIMASYMSSLEPKNGDEPNLNPTHKTNGDSHGFETDLAGSPKNGMRPIASSANRRKTSKPNQICDFAEDDDDTVYGNEPVDMMVPIKKRRLSTQQ